MSTLLATYTTNYLSSVLVLWNPVHNPRRSRPSLRSVSERTTTVSSGPSLGVLPAGESDLQPLSTAIQKFKYNRDLSVGKTLALLAAASCPFAHEQYDMIIPVPLHLARLRWRGFNQALLLSRAIGTTHGITVDPLLLERARPTVPQTQLTGKERHTNVKGAFTVSATDRLHDKRVLLVDDVYTSGATVTECARTLVQAGAQAVDVFTLARAVS